MTLRSSALLVAGTIAGVTGGAAQTNVPGFPVTLAGSGVNQSSIVIGDVDGDGQADDIVVGGRDGRIYAYRGDGSQIFTFDTGTTGVDSRAAIGDIDADGFPEVVVTAGSNIEPGPGRLVVLSHTGAFQCEFIPLDVIPDGMPDGIITSVALADLDHNDGGRLEIAFGAWDHRVRVLHDNCTPLWQDWVLDTVYSSPAIGDLDGDGDLDVVIGADSHLVTGQTTDGGLIVAYDGATGVRLPGFPIQLDEVIASSPALADLDRDGKLDIVVGTGNCWGSGNAACGSPQHPGVGERILALNRTGTALPGWPVAIPGQIADGSPAIADIDDDGYFEVVISGFVRGSGPPPQGKIWVLEHTGAVAAGFPKSPMTPSGCGTGSVSYASPASPIVADIDGDSDLDIVLPSNGDLVAWESVGGAQLTRTSFSSGGSGCQTLPSGALVFATAWSLGGSAAVGDIDNDGLLELVVGGYQSFPNVSPGALYAWNLPTAADGPAPWPMFKRDARGRSLSLDVLLVDGFESEDFSAWSANVP
jgi:hypothetical protein